MKILRLALVLLLATPAFADGLNARALRKLARQPKGDAKIVAFNDVCSTVRNVTGHEFLYKSEISQHISHGDRRSSGPTLICNRVCPSRFPAALYYSDGTQAARLGYYGRWNVSGKPRAYCAAGGAPACSNRTLSAGARQRGRDGFLYLQTSSTRGRSVCYRVRPNGRTGNAL